MVRGVNGGVQLQNIFNKFVIVTLITVVVTFVYTGNVY